MKAERKRGRTRTRTHSTLDHPHNIHRLCVTPLPQLEVQELVRLGGGQRGLLFREREHEERGALSLTFNFTFVGLGRAAVRHLFILTTHLLQQRKRRPSHLPPSHICTTSPLLQSQPLAALSNSHFTDRYRTSHSLAPSPLHAWSHTGACTPAPRRARPPPRGKWTLPCPSVCAAGVLYREEVGLAGVDSRGAGLR